MALIGDIPLVCGWEERGILCETMGQTIVKREALDAPKIGY